jgi:GTP cyclohydrolase IA
VPEEYLSSCEALVNVLKLQYKGWEGAQQFTDTPRRLDKMYSDLCWTPNKIEVELDKQFRAFENGYNEMLVHGPTVVRTLCPHHLLPVRMKVWIGYIPDGKVLGISKFSRISVIMGKRPIMQEQYAPELADLLMAKLKPKGLAVYVWGSHSCMTHRGIEQDAAVTTSAIRGVILQPSARAEFLAIQERMQ